MKCEGGCCAHGCGCCVFPLIAFGILFLVVGLNVLPQLTWLNGWSLLGAGLLISGVMAAGMMKK